MLSWGRTDRRSHVQPFQNPRQALFVALGLGALDEELERVDSMMFIRTVKTDAAGEVQRDADTGEVAYEDDGC